MTPSFPTRRSSVLADPRARHPGRALAGIWLAAGTDVATPRTGADPCVSPLRRGGRSGRAGQHGREAVARKGGVRARSEEHTSELQSLMRISYAVLCLEKKNHII